MIARRLEEPLQPGYVSIDLHLKLLRGSLALVGPAGREIAELCTAASLRVRLQPAAGVKHLEAVVEALDLADCGVAAAPPHRTLLRGGAGAGPFCRADVVQTAGGVKIDLQLPSAAHVVCNPAVGRACAAVRPS